MAAGVFEFAKGRAVRYADLPGGSDQLVAVLLSASEIESTLETYDNLGTLLGQPGNTEATFTGYTAGGQDLTGVNVIDNANDNSIDAVDPQWSPTSQETLVRIIICYDPDGTNTAANMVPLFHDDFGIQTPTSGTITYQVSASGFLTAS